MTTHPTACILCAENCGLEVEVEGRKLTKIKGDKSHPHSKGYLCQKAARLDHYQNHADRLTTPLKRNSSGGHDAISWEQAIREIASKLVALRAAHGGDCYAFYGGGGQGNHLGGAYANALRAAMGSPYFYSALAQEKTGDFWVNGRLFGRQTCHVTADVEAAEFVLFLGTNPWQSHGFPRARKVLKTLKKEPARTMVVIDPRRTETAKMADHHLQVRPGHDAHLLGAILGALVQEQWVDQRFLAERTDGAEDVLEALRQIPVNDWAERAGIAPDELWTVARKLGEASSATVRADLGIQQSAHSTLNSYLEKLVFLLTGNFGIPGGNNLHAYLVPLLGHSGDDGPRTRVTGAIPIGKLYPPNALPLEIDTDHPNRVRALWVDSANPLVSGADTEAYRAAMARLDLSVCVDVAMTETAQHAQYVLPASSQFEKAEATFFNLTFPENTFHLRHPLFSPLPGTLTEAEIYRRILVAMGDLPERFPVLERAARLHRRFPRSKALPTALAAVAKLRPKLAPVMPLVLYSTLGRTLPRGMEAAAVLWSASLFFATRHAEAMKRAGIVDQGAGLGEALFEAILTSPRGLVISEHSFADHTSMIRTANKKVALAIPELLTELEALNDEEGTSEFPFLLQAGERRSYNANTILRDPTWRKSDTTGALRIHPDDADTLGVADGDTVEVSTHRGAVQVLVERCIDLQPGLLSLPHGYGLSHVDESGERVQTGPLINLLTDSRHCDPLTWTPYHKGVPVRVRAV